MKLQPVAIMLLVTHHIVSLTNFAHKTHMYMFTNNIHMPYDTFFRKIRSQNVSHKFANTYWKGYWTKY